jgi:glycine/D-amino acid oxidase-like deaminating enzyme
MSGAGELDYLVIGGGFYGAALALFLRSLSNRTVLVESGSALMQRASRVNQARVHTGFHYPRNALTAVKSLMLHQRFARDFRRAIVDDFDMLYGVARYRSRISANRFHRMFHNMGAPIVSASPAQSAMFSSDTIEAVFACSEYAFDYRVLQNIVQDRLARAEVETRLNTKVESLSEAEWGVVVALSDGTELRARYVFNVTYANVNHLLSKAGLPLAPLKYELAEIALVTPPPELRHLGITVMDGPFFSVMPYPAESLHSLSHVRYTPHKSWQDNAEARPPYDVLKDYQPESRVRHMIADARRYVPAIADARPETSLFEVKTVLLKNEKDDGRPILYQRNPTRSRIISVVGGKIDNIFDLIRATQPEWNKADMRFLLPRGGSA